MAPFKKHDSEAKDDPQNQELMLDRHFYNPNTCIILVSQPVDWQIDRK